MDELKKYTDELFAKQRQTAKIRDLKDEVYSNLLAKKQDLISRGLSESEAIAKTKDGFSSVDPMIEGNQLTYINRFKKDCLQTLLLYGVILWLLSIPTIIMGMPFSFITFVIMAGLGVSYLKSNQSNQDEIAFINGDRFKTVCRTAWIIWGTFFAVCAATVTAVMYGSNIWFGRPVHIAGPYEFASIAILYYMPATTILLPIAISSFPKILVGNERNDKNE